jgi:hypothetical protein
MMMKTRTAAGQSTRITAIASGTAQKTQTTMTRPTRMRPSSAKAMTMMRRKRKISSVAAPLAEDADARRARASARNRH